jgi:ABC-2 type transport system permease protein
MSTLTSPETRPATGTRTPPRSYAGTGSLIRLTLRRERIPLLVWVVGIAAVAASTFSAFVSLYPAEAEREALAFSVTANPAFLALTGPVASTSIGGLTAWRIGVLGTTLIGLMAIVTVVRRTRADEEAGRSDLLASSVVGRAAPLAAAVAVASGAGVAIGILVAAAGIANGQPLPGSIALGASLAGCGVVYAGVAAVAVQLVENARTATALSAAVLAVGFGLRAVGDVTAAASWSSWLSPQGWAQHVRAYGQDNWAVLVLFVLVAAALLVVARMLLDGRDLGLALFPARLGPAGNDRLDSPLALAIRLQRGPVIGWVVGFIAFGAIMGSIAASAGDLLDSNPQLQDVLAKLGGAGALTDMFLAAIGSLGGLAVGGYAISAALRMSSEESADRLGPVLAGSVARTRWMSGHLLFVLLGPVLVLGAAGLVAGLIHGARIGDVGGGLQSTLSAMLVQAPPALVMGGIAVALFGCLPRWTSVAWAALVIALLLGQLGALLQLPQALMNLSPYTHVPPVPAEPINWVSTIVLLAVAAGLMVAGLLGFRHRDVN